MRERVAAVPFTVCQISDAPSAVQRQPYFTELLLEQITMYDRNPRKADNAMKGEIKASIEARGMDTPLCVTQRPGDKLYMLQSGGNTRLMILNELWNETHDEKYHKVPVMIHPWVDEVHVLVGHLAENTLRGEMCFADTAAAIMRMKTCIEAGDGPIRWKDYEQRLVHLGFRVSHTQISRMRFLDKYLSDVLPEDVRIQFGPHHVQKLMSALKGSDYLDVSRKDHLTEIFNHHGINIDAAIDEMMHPPTSASDCEAEMGNVGGLKTSLGKDAEKSLVEQLQMIIDLRRKNYLIVMDMPCAPYFKESGEGIGFRVSHKQVNSDPLEKILSELSAGKPDSSINLLILCELNDLEISAVMRILRNIRDIYIFQMSCDKVGVNNSFYLTNSEIIHIQDVLIPESANERRLIKEYIQHDSTRMMLMSLFPGIDVGRISEMRVRLGYKNLGGRPVKAFPTEEFQILRLWKKHQKVEEKQRYLMIAKQVELPLGTVWNTVRSWIHRDEGAMT